MLAFSVPSKLSTHDPPRLSTLPPNALFPCRQGAHGVQWHCNVSVVFNGFSIVTSEAQEASEVHTVFRLRPIHYCMGHKFVGVETILVKAKAAKIDFRTSPGAFCMFGLVTMCCQYGKHLSDMYHVFFQGTALNHSIVKVSDDEFAFH